VKENPVAHCAALLAAAEEQRQPGAPLTELYPQLTLRDAYAVQQINIERRVRAGELVRGHKIGLTSRAMQRASAINEPDYGSLMADMFYNTGEEIPMSRFIQPRLECELGFVMGKRLKGPNCTIFDVLNAVGEGNAFLQYDLYHMQIMEGDLAMTIERLLPRIGHMQIADVPARNEPGTGELNFDFLLRHIDSLGYSGWIGAEYNPKGDTVEGLKWARAFLS